jgi:hypothetical protein
MFEWACFAAVEISGAGKIFKKSGFRKMQLYKAAFFMRPDTDYH